MTEKQNRPPNLRMSSTPMSDVSIAAADALIRATTAMQVAAEALSRAARTYNAERPATPLPGDATNVGIAAASSPARRMSNLPPRNSWFELPLTTSRSRDSVITQLNHAGVIGGGGGGGGGGGNGRSNTPTQPHRLSNVTPRSSWTGQQQPSIVSPTLREATLKQITAAPGPTSPMSLRSPRNTYAAPTTRQKHHIFHVRARPSSNPIPLRSQRYSLSDKGPDQDLDIVWTSLGRIGNLSPPDISGRSASPRVNNGSFRGPVSLSRPHEAAFVFLVCLAQVMTFASLSSTIAALPNMVVTFPAPRSPTWYSASYSLTLGAFILPSGRFGDVFGHKKLFLIGWAVFAFFSVLAGFAPAIAAARAVNAEIYFSAVRGLQGIGPAILMPNAMALLGRMYEQGMKKNMMFALFGWMAPCGFVIGCVMNSLFARSIGWQWAFWVLGIVCALFVLLGYIIVPDLGTGDGGSERSSRQNSTLWVDRLGRLDEKENESPPRLSNKMGWRQRWHQLDGNGSFLGITALLLLNISLNQAPIVGWSTPHTYFLLIISSIFFLLFFRSQSPKRNPHALIPLDVLDLNSLLVLICTMLGWSAFGVWIFYIWDFMMSAKGGPALSGLRASAWFAPAPVAGLFASAATGVLLSRLHPRWIMLFSMWAFFVGMTLTATAAPLRGNDSGLRSYFTGVFWAVCIMPFGMDMSFPSATILLSNRVGSARQGVAASLVNTVVNYGISIGLGIAGTVVRYTSQTRLGMEVLSVEDCKHAWYAGMGLSGLGVLIATVFVATGILQGREEAKRRSLIGTAV